MTRETVDRILGWLSKTDINTVDLTGGAPEMMPDFRYLVGQLRKMPQVEDIIDRCNLTILLEPGYQWLGEFLVVHRVKIVASMPCYQLRERRCPTGRRRLRFQYPGPSTPEPAGLRSDGGPCLSTWFTIPMAIFSHLTRQNLKPTTNGS